MRSSPYDRANLIADFDSIRISLASPEKIQGKAKARAQAQKDQQTIQALPAQAAMMKAQAISQKAQGGQPQPQPQGQPQPPATAPGVQNAQPPIPMGPNEVQL